MFPFILTAFLIAKVKKYKILPIFKSYALYPLFAVEITYLFFQANIFMANYNYIKYTSILQFSYIIVLFVPIIVYKLYGQALVGSGLMLVGTLLNKFVIHMNDGKMPVYATLSKITGYFKPDSLTQGSDGLHVLINQGTHYKILTDYIDVGWSIMSVGDVMIHSFIGIMVYYTIKAVNTAHSINKEIILT